ncbi:MAG TPA: helix-turn-helix transcriptional regulator [Acidimicrobiales bacterium]|nr:helix-turn-helix transcriptional regulator [Acidimicrobiales bacterium]
MNQRLEAISGSLGQSSSRFEFAPPRHFVLPAIVLLLSERPSYGYNLVKDLHELRFGRVDRPSVYRALAQLERDGLVESWAEAAKAGQDRRVYGLTERGERTLRAWMGVIKEERDGLDRVLRRYQATRTADALLAEVEGGWGAVLGAAWSSVSPTSLGPRRIPPEEARPRSDAEESCSDSAPGAQRFVVTADRSVVLIDVRSTVGPISFGALGVHGFVEANVSDGEVRAGTHPTAHLEIGVDGLRSGNGLYDAELLRRIDARRFPIATIDLRTCAGLGAHNRYRLAGEVGFHGKVRPVKGTVLANFGADGKLIVTGEQVFDIRDFEIASPTVLMLRIYPDVRVHLHVEAERED